MNSQQYLDSELEKAIEAAIAKTEPAFIFICQNPACDLNPTIGSVPLCDSCGGSNCALMVDGREDPPYPTIFAHSELGLELQRLMGLA